MNGRPIVMKTKDSLQVVLSLQKHYLTLLLACVGITCFLTSIFLYVCTDGQNHFMPMTSSVVLKRVSHKRPDGNDGQIWIPNIISNYEKPLRVLKSMVAAGACLSLMAIVLTSSQMLVTDDSINIILGFVVNVGIFLTGVFLAVCLSAYVTGRFDPGTIFHLDQNAVVLLNILASIICVASVTVHLMQSKSRTSGTIIHV